MVDFPKGLVAPPTQFDRVLWFLRDNTSGIVGMCGLIVVAVYYVFVWTKVGRDPKRGTIVVRYEPPEGLSPAAMRYLKHRSYDDRSLVSAIVDLGVKKQLAIEEVGSAYRMTRLQSPNAELSPEESKLLQNLFSASTTLTIGSQYESGLAKASATLESDLRKLEAGWLHSNAAKMVLGILISLATFGLMLLEVPDVDNSRTGAAILSIFVCVFPLAVIGMIRQGWKTRKNLIGAAVFTVAWIAMLAFFIFLTNVSVAVVLALLIAANAIFYSKRTALTPAGRALLDEVDGFQEFLVAVESDRIRRLNPPNKTPELFERYLPYALALSVEQRWAEQFAGVLAQAATATGETINYFPSFYMSSSQASFDAGRFTSSLSDGFSSALSSSSSPPGSSSGSDSSGSSGGGGGGGGGGGW